MSAATHAPPQPPVVIDEAGRQVPHAQQRPRKTSIQGPSGTWNLGKTIGAGSMGKVKLARRADGSEQVAVKIVPRQLIQEHGIDPATGQPYPPRHDDSKEIRTAREAAIVTLLDHPYICGMRDVIKTNNHWYMLCEYVNGGQMLDYIISHGRLKEKQARKFGRQIASALDYCHRNSIVHRDLKIENILISKTGDIKIIDFGLSNLFSPRSHLRTFCGSLYFAAPELLQAKQYIGPEVDVWSFGIVLYVLVCGKVPFDDQNMPALHAKIKRGMVDYPQWLSNDCRHLLSRMLVTDPRQRATLQEIMTHPWLMKGYSVPPENCLPAREPLTLPLDPLVISGMTGFEFGSSEIITSQLTKIVSSEEYQNAVKQAQRDAPLASSYQERKKPFAFDFYKRRSSTSSKDTLTNLSTEVLPYTQTDPINAYNPLVSVYYLVRERLERDRQKAAPGSHVTLPASETEKVPHMSVPRQPEAAHTSETSYEVRGEPAATSGRTRPRARTHGDDEVSEAVKNINMNNSSGVSPAPSVAPPKVEQPSSRKDLSVGGMLRRLSTRRHQSHHRGESTKGDLSKAAAPPTLSLQPPDQPPSNLPKTSLSLRRQKEPVRPTHNDTSQPGQPDLLTPPTTADAGARKTKPLGRSTSVSEVDWRRKYSRPRASMEPPGTSGSERSVAGTDNPKSFAQRAKSVGHAKRDMMQSRRTRKDDSGSMAANPDDVATDDNADVATSMGSGDPNASATPSSDFVKPVFLKGLFSVSTTSTKPPIEIRKDIIRVLDQLGVSYREIKGGFVCVHRPSIDLKSVVEGSSETEATNMVSTSAHRRKISFGNTGGSSSQQGSSSKQTSSRRQRADTSYTNSDASNDSVNDGVLGGSLILQFEIYIVKVPLLSLHGIQFKSHNKTNTWQYKSLASRILSELKL
ncbi:kinase-like domain-containing protein [Tricharina praecox]|uniref:kinase-like domain-containing protein n=1 Tax=Tricharina praecox TaxID=43433 RepID=UPI00222078A2|nr:kinase-like domain-containing protein [Tricharina praecox]KAI5855674.1 kinase-like domain-containing protein [Tricharina praecox]